MAHRLVNIIADFFIIPFQVIQKILYINPFRCKTRRTIVFNCRKLSLAAVFFYQFLPQISQGPDDVQLAAEYSLIGNHRTDFPPVKHVDQQRFNDVRSEERRGG